MSYDKFQVLNVLIFTTFTIILYICFFLLFPDSCSTTDGLGVCHSRNEVTDVLENKVHEADRPSLYHQHSHDLV